ncbi:MAG: UDP-N-acetylmuramoyl-L-alanyl-D-glutamate--2,6-diaminopimelate ligase [Reyranellaceae bacterium]
MRLTELIHRSGLRPPPSVLPPQADPEIAGLSADSRQVQPGFLFAALTGARADGARFIADARARGAVAALVGEGAAVDAADLALVRAQDARLALARFAAGFYGIQPRIVAAVTGTNGKSSVAHFTRSIWQALGLKAASMGTLGLVSPHLDRPGGLTTPDPVALHRDLAALARAGVDHLALEASSHGLDQRRLDGIRFAAAAWTNLSRDHLDYHRSMAAYFAAKARLFADLLPEGGAAIINADTPEAEALVELCLSRGHRLLRYGAAGTELKLLSTAMTAHGQHLALDVMGELHEVELKLVGAYQAANVLAALGLVLAEDIDIDRALAALATLEGAPGRLQHVGSTRDGAPVYVDYAHTPDALETVLKALRPHAKQRLLLVFGCGGDRDAGKRPIMGGIAARLADLAILTDDNPRTEDAAAIRRAVREGAPGAANLREIGDRHEAIAAAVAALRAGDALVIAGKGHEPGQIVGATVLPFDDAEVARAALRQGGAA